MTQLITGSMVDATIDTGAARAAALTAAIAALGLGTAASANIGTSPNQVVQLDGSGKLPAVDASQLTHVSMLPFFAGGQSSGSTATGGGAQTKLAFSALADTGGYWSAANNRYQPLVAGWYHVNGGCGATINGSVQFGVALYKNGAAVGQMLNGSGAGVMLIGACISTVVFLNGTTDYIELFCVNGDAVARVTDIASTFFHAYRLV